ncbi:MAG TPA: TonB-dependent siderophore receptor [Povalibacter sp.]|uniref:TonB-dependent siderophore receptor n=1 Tax=Povalibacter sp. TaxID=1962978 RepID=UPI002CBBC689|nr:TonB-dependent siderophore receptor [Povalibacter sp.]HMN43773.1 TonB-dependent siderophore receptor [Povalibacter sp.]
MYASLARRRLAVAVVAVLCGSVTAFSTVIAQTPAVSSEVRSYDIPAGSLTQVLNQFAQRAGVALSFDPQLTSGKQSGGLSGSYAVAQGFAQLLGPHGLQAVPGANGYSLQPAPIGTGSSSASEQTLRAIKVQATLDATTEGTGSYTTGAVAVGSRVPRDLRQIQQSVGVVTSQRILDQNLTTTDEALKQVTGITVIPDSGGAHSAILSRGFDVTSVQFDGGPPSMIGYGAIDGFDEQGLPDLAPYDHVEVLRGSDGLYSGSGEPGGSINLVRKRPLGEFQFVADLLAASWDRFRAQVDVTGAIASSERVRGRFVAAFEDREYYYDVAEQDKVVLYGVLEADVTDRTLLTVGATYEDDDQRPNFIGLPRYATGDDPRLPRDTCLCSLDGYWNRQATDVFLGLEQILSAQWNLKLNLTRRDTETRAKHLYPVGAVNPVTLLGPQIYTYHYAPDVRQVLADLSVNGSFDVAGHRQELTLGVNLQDIDHVGDGGYYYLDDTTPVIDVFDFDPAAFPMPVDRAQGNPFGTGQRQEGVFASLRSEWTRRLHSVLGLRVSDYRYESFDSTSSDQYEDSGIVTPFGGVTFDLTPQVSLYASYADTFVVQNVFTAQGERLDPKTGETYEIGAKGAWYEGRLTGSVAVYRAQQKNEGILDFEDFSRPYQCCYIEGPNVRRSRGFDAEVSGELVPGWEFSAGYTYNDNELRTAEGASRRFSSQTPEHLLKLWTMYQLPGTLSAWRLGAGLNAQSKSYFTGEVCDGLRDDEGECISETYVPYDITQDAYAIVGVRVERRFGDRWSAALNVDNLFDETYYASVGYLEGFNYYGQPRNFTLSLRGRF